MPKMTTKYRTALEAVNLTGEKPPVASMDNQERLYAWLNEREYFWDSELREWEKVVKKTLPYGSKDEGICVAHIRLSCHPDYREDFLRLIHAALKKGGYKATNESKTYPNREDYGERTYTEFRP